MTLTDQTVEIHAGNTRNITATVLDSDGNVVDLSGADDIEWVVHKDVRDGVPLIYKAFTAGSITHSGSGGVITIPLDPADTKDLAGSYYHECELEIDGKDVTLFTGRFEVVPTAID